MAGLSDLSFNRAYHKPEDDIARDFYLPAFAAARTYDRAVGYFSSTIFLIAWLSLKPFVRNGGKMRLICSPVLSDVDHDAMREGYSARANEAFAGQLQQNLSVMMESATLRKPAIVLASLVASGVIDCKVAWVGETAGGQPKRLFHDKVGILSDQFGQSVVFKGSMNETWPGLALDGNLESVDVFASWRDASEGARVRAEAEYFNRLWENTWPGVVTQPLPEAARSAIISAADSAHWPELVDEICLDLERAATWSASPSGEQGRTPRLHQVQALEAWKARGRRGIFEHATGSGKTFTALCAINDGFRSADVPLVLVPSDLLLQQWDRELRATFPDMQLLVCGGGHSDWRKGGRLRSWTRSSPGARPKAVLSTMQTAATTEFIGTCSQGPHLFMVADEVHRMGADETRKLFALETGPRLGLSATPERAGDPQGTAAILNYFEGIVPPPFTLEDAISAGALTKYSYTPHAIRLERDEQEQWLEISKDIRRLAARLRNAKSGDQAAESRMKRLLIKRARLVKAARAKVATAAQVLRQFYATGQRWIVYCDDQGQLRQVSAALRHAGLDAVYEYHSNMQGDRARTLDVFASRGGIVVSIRCLDEGVDIPSVSHALILASSRNPREFVQRRGRVLRLFPGKHLAHIHDIVVTPVAREKGDDLSSMLNGELARAIEFGRSAINPGAIAELNRIAAEFGVDLAEAQGGFEDDASADQAEEK